MSRGYGEGERCDVCDHLSISPLYIDGKDVCRYCMAAFTPEQSRMLNDLELRIHTLESRETKDA